MSRVSNRRAENGVRNARVWRALLGVDNTVIERVEFEDTQVLVVHVRPGRVACGRCGRVVC